MSRPPLTDRIIDSGMTPDFVIRRVIRRLLSARLRDESAGGVEAQSERARALVESLSAAPVAIDTAAANEQHYEVPTAFYECCLGPRLKYSSAYYGPGVRSLAQAEVAMLELYAQRARLDDGQRILELGCGWGSLCLWLAERYPRSSITAVSNSRTQREHIEARCREMSLTNLRVVTADMNSFDPADAAPFDRVVSVEMFEHMKNYRVLMARIASWLTPGGLLFVHIFTHRTLSYPFEAKRGAGPDQDWLARHFFTGGIMPSDDLLLHFQHDLTLLDHWRVPGTHYGRTAEDWLRNLDSNRDRAIASLATAFPNDATARFHRWRVFYMACAELWNYRRGSEWMVSHYLFGRRGHARTMTPG